MRILRWLATGVFVVFLPILLVTTNVRVLAGDVALYEHGFRKYDVVETTGVQLSELDRAAATIVDYFENDTDDLRIVVSEGDREAALFSEQEIDHMRDVKDLMRIIFRLNEIALAVVVVYIGTTVLWAREKTVRRLALEALAGIGVAFVALLIIGAIAFTGFDSFWNNLHEVLFTNDLWQLDPDTDRLIQMFPEPFWEEASYIFAAMTAAEAIAVILLCLAYLVFSNGHREPRPPRARARRLRRRASSAAESR